MAKKTLKDLFFVPDSPEAQAPTEESKIRKEVFTPSQHEARPTVAQPEASPQPTSTAVANDEMVAQIWEQIINRNLPGPDYLELRNNASALEGLPLTEEQRLEAAFKVLKKTYPSLTKDVILKSIDTYVGVVNEEKASGMEQCKAARQATIGEKESRLKVMRDTNQETLRQLNELKKRYEETELNIRNMEHEVLTATQEMDAREKAFLASIDSAIAVLNSDKNKIATLNF